MLTPEQLQNLPTGITQKYTELADFIIRDICRRISESGKITDTAEYQIYRAKALGLSNKEIRNKIAEINGVSEKEVNKLFRDVAKTSDEFDRKVFKQPEDAGTPLAENKVLQQTISAQAKQTNETFENITGTMGFAEKRNGQVVYSSLTDTLRNEMDMAHLKISSGATDYITAIRAATKKLSDSGVRTIYYESGRSDRVDVAVRRAVLTGTSQVVQKISEQNGEQFGADGWEISAHSGARPSHAVYQGRQYPQKDYERIVKPLVEDYNCRHSAYPIILGVSEPTYTEEELKNIDPPPITYEGKTYTAYEATQQQRKMERAMRRQKDLCIASDAAGDKDGFTTASIKLRRQNEIYKDFSEKAGLYTQYERTQVQGFNRSISAKSTWAVRKESIYYAKATDLFSIIGPVKGDAIKAQSLFKALNKNSIGKEALDYITKGNVNVEVNYTDECEKNIRGFTLGHSIVVYAKNTKTIKCTASTIIHEVVHAKYKIGGNAWAEAQCFAAEKIYEKGMLTISDKRAIIKEVKELYPTYEWRRKKYG